MNIPLSRTIVPGNASVGKTMVEANLQGYVNKITSGKCHARGEIKSIVGTVVTGKRLDRRIYPVV